MHGFNLLNQKIYVPQTMLHLTGHIKHYIKSPKGMFLANIYIYIYIYILDINPQCLFKDPCGHFC